MDNNSESKDDPKLIYSLPDEMYVRIFQLIPFEDLISLKKVNRRFHQIIDGNRHRLRKKNAYRVVIASNCRGTKLMINLIVSSFKRNRQPFSVKEHYKSFITDKDEFLRSLQMFNEKTISLLDVHGTDSPDIFKILANWCQKGSHLETLSINDFGDDNFQTFHYFINKIPDVRDISIRHICTRNRSDEDLSKLGLESLHKLEKVYFCECEHTVILNSNFILRLYRKNPRLGIIEVSSCNRTFIEELLVDFVNDQCQNYPCNHSMVTLYINTTHCIHELVKTYREIFYNLDHISYVSILGQNDDYNELRIGKKCGRCFRTNKEIQIKFSNSMNPILQMANETRNTYPFLDKVFINIISLFSKRNIKISKKITKKMKKTFEKYHCRRRYFYY